MTWDDVIEKDKELLPPYRVNALIPTVGNQYSYVEQANTPSERKVVEFEVTAIEDNGLCRGKELITGVPLRFRLGALNFQNLKLTKKRTRRK